MLPPTASAPSGMASEKGSVWASPRKLAGSSPRPRPAFADLGDIIRKVRIDFGTEIDLYMGYGDAKKALAMCAR